MSDYRDVIFDENRFYDSYDEDDFLKKTKKADLVEFRALDLKLSYEPIDSDDEEWLETPIRDRSLQPPGSASSSEGVRQMNEASSFQTSQSTSRLTPASTSKRPSSSIQLHTSDETSIRIPERPLSRYTGDDRSSFSFRASASSESYENVTQRHKKSSKRPTVDHFKSIDFSDLFETHQTPLEITDFRPERKKISADLDEAHIIQKRRTRRPNPKYADSAYLAYSAYTALKAMKKFKLTSTHIA